MEFQVGWRNTFGGLAGLVARLLDLTRDRSASVAVEFALVLPVLAVLLFATIQFGITLNNYIELANGASAGARQLSISRGSATPGSSTITMVDNAAPNLTAAKITTTMTVGSTTCDKTDSAACVAAFSAGSGNPCGCSALVTLTYPCNLNFWSIKFASCTLKSSAQELVQ
jgi:Flp pilus assembly protein TadG